MLQVAVADSLPLMGIENPRTSSGFPPAEYRSLPLMGIENPFSQAPPRSSPATHYPSWGSKTGRPRRRGSWCGSQAHYPSWGSKTGDSLASPRLPVAASLPLMGIENPDAAEALRMADLVSLPLMGIENTAKEDALSRAKSLITPHGDRKP